MDASRLLLVAALVFAAPFMAACDLASTVQDSSLVVASVHVVTSQAAVEDEYTGSGFFGTAMKNRHLPSREWVFALHSAGRGDSQGMAFTFYGPERERPAVGTYTIGEDSGEFVVGFLRPNGERFDRFRSIEGVVEITSSTRDRVEGTFRLTGHWSGECGIQANGMWCHIPPNPDPSVRAEASGHFEAVPGQVQQRIPLL